MEVSDNGGLHGVLRFSRGQRGELPERQRVSEQAELFGAVADQQIFLLAVVVEHHEMVLAADAGDLVGAGLVTRPHPGAQSDTCGPICVSASSGSRCRIALIRSGVAYFMAFLFLPWH